MKLRQKLAIVLASAMIITAVPVVTSAASTNGFNKTVSMVEGTALTTTSAVNLDMRFDAEKTAQTTTFFVDAQDFEFNADEYKIKAGVAATEKANNLVIGNATISVLSKSQLKVTVNVGTTATDVS
ncbi:MAG: hypothetical protein RSD98_12810, partial [Niameybacter sp.]